MKTKIVSLLFAALTALSVNAVTSVTTITSSATTTNALLPTAQLYVSQITVANATAVTNTLAFYDAPTNVLAWTRAAYTNTVTFSTNIVQTFTNFSGVTQSVTNAAVYTVSNPVAAATSNYKSLTTIVVGPGSTVTYTPVNGLLTSFGLAATSLTNATVTVEYSNIR